MPWSLLRALIDTTRPAWRLVLVVVLLVLIWLALRQADRIASAVNLWMLAKAGRPPARKRCMARPCGSASRDWLSSTASRPSRPSGSEKRARRPAKPVKDQK